MPNGDPGWGAYRLLSSNPRKLEEYARQGLPLALASGEDLAEVDGTPDEVIIRKSESAGIWTVVEDTVLEIDGRPVVDIRWRVDELAGLDGAAARFSVSLAANNGTEIRMWRGHVDGMLRVPSQVPIDAFGFEAFFVPDGGNGLSLHELDAQGRKDGFSARTRAARALVSQPPALEVTLSELEPWTGPWQSDGSVACPRR